MKTTARMSIATLVLLAATTAANDMKVVDIHKISDDGVNEKIGTIRIEDTAFGALFTPRLKNIEDAGLHGFHVHQNPNCGPGVKSGETKAGIAAGDHLDPDASGNHAGPFQKKGHLGDLPALYVNNDGTATHPVLAPKIKSGDLRGRALVIHAGGDNYSDQPELGGGGARIACGIVGEKN